MGKLSLNEMYVRNGVSMPNTSYTLTREQRDNLQTLLKERFEKHPERHPALGWADVIRQLEVQPHALWSLYRMEETGGEPDVVELGAEITFVDCSPESPKGRRSLCYDVAAPCFVSDAMAPCSRFTTVLSLTMPQEDFVGCFASNTDASHAEVSHA